MVRFKLYGMEGDLKSLHNIYVYDSRMIYFALAKVIALAL